MKIFSRKKVFLMLVISIFSLQSYGQTTVKGKIFDNKTKIPIEFATIIVQSRISNYIDGSTSDTEGSYTISNVPNGTLELSVSCLGYSDISQTIVIDGSKNELTIPLYLNKNVEVLKGVEVTGMKPQMRLELDKKVFDVGQSTTAAGASASDILQDIPSVEVSTDGEISLRGNTAVTIWLNGKASGLTADNQAQVLEQLPADAIERIEVITNPSAKYSPEGTAGIINIVLKEDRKAGYYGSVQAGVNSRFGYNVSGNVNYSSPKFDFFASIGFRSRKMDRGGYSNRKYLNENNDTIGFLNQTTNADGRNNNIFTRLGVTYHLTKKDDISLTGFGMFGGGKSTTNVDYSSDLPDNFATSNRNTARQDTMTGGNIQLGYKHEFSKKSNLDLSASFNIWKMGGMSNFRQNSLFANSTSSSSFQRQISDMNNKMAEFKADYTNSFSENHKFEAGYQGNFGWNNSPMTTYSGLFESTLTTDTALCNTFLYDRIINAIYATYSGKIKNFNFLLGLRGEQTYMKTQSSAYGEPDNEAAPHIYNNFDLFPSAFLSYQFPKENQLQINYTRRISRPWGGQLNSFKNITDSTNISYGNPNLTPEYSNSFELNYIKTWDNHIFSLSGYYRSSNDVIQRISFMQDGLMNTTPENIAKTASTGSEMVLKNRFFKFLNLTTTLNLYYYYLQGFDYEVQSTGQHIIGNPQENFTWDIRMIAQTMLPKGFMLQLTGGYNAPRAIAQGTREARFFLDAGIRKSVGDWTFNINGRDLLNSSSRKSTTEGKGFWQEQRNWRGGRTITLSVTYSFGNLKPDMKNRNRNNQQENGEDDSQMGGDMGAGGE
jgi:outer membrane receptor protein involved in Fe transport